MASIREIADHLNVSPATVSRVLNSRPGIGENTRKRVMQAATQMGFGRHVGLRTSRYIGFVHPLGHFVGEMGDYHSALIGGIAAHLAESQYDLALIDPYRDKRPDESYAQFFMRKDLRGVLMQVKLQNEEVTRQIAEEGFPMVSIAIKSDDPRVNWVVCDSGREFGRAVEYLHRLGHRRIAIATLAHDVFDQRDRIENYLAAHRRLGLPIDPQLQIQVNNNPASGGSVIRELYSLASPPTALMLTGTRSMSGVLRACGEMGLNVPGDLSIIGIDDTNRRYESIPVFTAICQDSQRLGREAAAQMLTLLETPSPKPVRITLPAVFEVHQTTGPAPR